MAVMDEFNKERESLKNAPFSEKIGYFWDYYRYITLVIIIAILVVTSIVYTIATKKDTMVYTCFINAQKDDAESYDLENEFNKLGVIDSEKESIIIDTSLLFNENSRQTDMGTNSQKLTALIASRELDLIVTNEQAFSEIACEIIFNDLRDVLSEELLNQYQSRIYYVDKDLVFKLSEERDNLESNEINELIEAIMDNEDVSKMVDPMPVGIVLDKDSIVFDEYTFYNDEEIICGILYNSERVDTSISFMNMIFK